MPHIWYADSLRSLAPLSLSLPNRTETGPPPAACHPVRSPPHSCVYRHRCLMPEESPKPPVSPCFPIESQYRHLRRCSSSWAVSWSIGGYSAVLSLLTTPLASIGEFSTRRWPKLSLLIIKTLSDHLNLTLASQSAIQRLIFYSATIDAIPVLFRWYTAVLNHHEITLNVFKILMWSNLSSVELACTITPKVDSLNIWAKSSEIALGNVLELDLGRDSVLS